MPTTPPISTQTAARTIVLVLVFCDGRSLAGRLAGRGFVDRDCWSFWCSACSRFFCGLSVRAYSGVLTGWLSYDFNLPRAAIWNVHFGTTITARIVVGAATRVLRIFPTVGSFNRRSKSRKISMYWAVNEIAIPVSQAPPYAAATTKANEVMPIAHWCSLRFNSYCLDAFLMDRIENRMNSMMMMAIGRDFRGSMEG